MKTISKKILRNKVQVITNHREIPHVCHLMYFVKIGSRDETPEYSGISHFFEHLFFKSNLNNSTKEISDFLDMIGGEFNAYTTSQFTVYEVTCLNKYLTAVIEMFSHMIRNLDFNEDEVEMEKQVVLEEIAMRKDDPISEAFDILDEKAHAGSSLAMNIAGNETSVASFKQSMLAQYKTENYVTSKMAFIISGNMTDVYLKEGVSSIDNIFGQNTHYVGEIGADSPVTFIPGISYHQKDNSEQVNMCLQFQSISFSDPKIRELQVLNRIFGEGMSSILFQTLREKHGLAYMVGGFYSAFSDTGMYNIYIGTNKAKLDESARLISKCIQDISNELLPDNVIQKAKDSMRNSVTLGNLKPGSESIYLAKNAFFGGEPLTVEERMDLVDKVTSEGVRDIAKQIFNPKVMHVLYHGDIVGYTHKDYFLL